MPIPTARTGPLALLFIATLTLPACDRKPESARPPTPPATAPISADKTIRYYHQTPVSESLDPVIKSLTTQTLYIAVDDSPTTATTAAATQPNHLRFKTGVDKDGHHWVYAYTTEEDLARAVPHGAYVKIPFRDLFDTTNDNPRFAGLFLNSASDTKYPIPREFFPRVKTLLQK